VNEFDWELVDFVLSWQPYGDPPDDEVLVRFGMTPLRLRQRFGEIVESALAGPSEYGDDRQALLARARDHVWATRPTVGLADAPRPDAPPPDDDGEPGRWILRHGVRYWRRAG
jgi:hypothetical protein